MQMVDPVTFWTVMLRFRSNDMFEPWDRGKASVVRRHLRNWRHPNTFRHYLLEEKKTAPNTCDNPRIEEINETLRDLSNPKIVKQRIGGLENELALLMMKAGVPESVAQKVATIEADTLYPPANMSQQMLFMMGEFSLGTDMV